MTVGDVLRRFDGQPYHHHAWVIMPNHVHLLFSLKAGERLERALQGWKGVSSREVRALVPHPGPLWQKDYFDRMIRDAPHFWRCAKYIRRNPAKACLKPGEFLLFENPHVHETLNGEATPRSPDG